MIRHGACLASILIALNSSPAHAQPTGYVSVFGDYFPEKRDTAEMRVRVFVEEKVEPSPTVRITASGFVEGLFARRPDASTGSGEIDGIVRAQDANIELLGKRADLLAGYARIAWGKLDEIQPTDVVNPLDVSRFFFEGRSEARLPVLLVRGRVHPSEKATIEAVYVPDFRPGRFDRLAEATSPFNITAGVASAVDRQPRFALKNAQGGVRLSATTGTVDWSVSGFRGFEPFGLYRSFALEYPRFTMLGSDVEFVRGQWGIRGELAAFVDDNFQSPDLRVVSGRSLDVGAGVDRRAGTFTLSGTVLVHSESYDTPLAVTADRDGPPSPRLRRAGRTDTSFVMSLDRTFARERYRFRGFGVVNASEGSAFFRGIVFASLRDNLGVEGSIGWFAGSGRDVVGRFSDSDFGYVRLRWFF